MSSSDLILAHVVLQNITTSYRTIHAFSYGNKDLNANVSIYAKQMSEKPNKNLISIRRISLRHALYIKKNRINGANFLEYM